MDLICLGLNHQTAPVEVRERFAVPGDKLGEASHRLVELPGVNEAVVLSTCNRMEVYFVAEEEEAALQRVKGYLASGFELSREDESHFYKKSAVDVAKHLCRVVSGLDSMVLGENEIFGQVKQAYQQALDSSATGGILNKLFQKSFGVGKKVRTKTSIQEGQTSVGSVAVDLAEKIFGSLRSSEIMVIGAGDMSRTTAQRMAERGAKKIYVTNRSFDKAKVLADELNGEAFSFDEWEKGLVNVDVVVSSTGATDPVVLAKHVEAVRRARKYRPLFMIDIAVPRDIAPEVGEIEEVYLYDLDTLQQLVAENMNKREEQVRLCEAIINEEVVQFKEIQGR